MGEVNESGDFEYLRHNAWGTFDAAIDGAAL